MTTKCPSISFCKRPCTLDTHTPQQSCVFAEWPEDHDEYGMTYQVDDPQTLGDFLEAFSAGGPTALNAAITWCANAIYRMKNYSALPEDHIITRIYQNAEDAVLREGDLMRQYMEWPERAA